MKARDLVCLTTMLCMLSARQVRASRYSDREVTTAWRSSSVVLTYTAASVAHRSTPTSNQNSIIAANCTPRNCDWRAIWRELASAPATSSDCFARTASVWLLRVRVGLYFRLSSTSNLITVRLTFAAVRMPLTTGCCRSTCMQSHCD